MRFGEFEFRCPSCGPMTVGLDCIEDMVIHQRGHAEITLRCPRCGALVTIASPVPTLPRPFLEEISHSFGIPFSDGKLTFSALLSSFAAELGDFGGICGIEFSFEDDEEPKPLVASALSTDDERRADYFAAELDKLDSVDAFLSRAGEDDSNADLYK